MRAITEQRRHRAYLPRLWQASSNGKAVWRASLESAQTGERHGFADLASLVAFLEAQTGDDPNQDDRSPSTRL